MIIILFITTFLLAFVVASLVVFLFAKPIDSILKRLVPLDISQAWVKYLRFAIYVVGIGGGVRVWAFEKYLAIQDPYQEIVQLTSDRWVLEIYETIIGTLQSAAILLLVFFVVALVAMVIVRLFEARTTTVEVQKNLQEKE